LIGKGLQDERELQHAHVNDIFTHPTFRTPKWPGKGIMVR